MDNDIEDSIVEEIEYKYILKSVGEKELQENIQLTKRIASIKEEIKSSDAYLRYHDYQFNFDLNQALYVEAVDSTLHSYTFYIHNEDDSSDINNMVLIMQDDDEEYQAFLITYALTQEERDQLNNGEQLDLYDKATVESFSTDQINISSRVGSCYEYIEVGQEDCECHSTHAEGGCTHPDAVYEWRQVSCGGGGGVSSDPNNDDWNDGGGTGGTGGSNSSGSGGTSDSNTDGLEDCTSDCTNVVTAPNKPPVDDDATNDEVEGENDCDDTTDEDFNASYSINSPFIVDLSEVRESCDSIDISNVVENEKFMCIYNKLTQSVGFKNLFLDTFGESENLNVKFQLDDSLPNNVGGKTIADPNDPSTIINGELTLNLIVKINKNHLDISHISAESSIEIAKNILHESIHTFLFVKKYSCDSGTSIDILNNQLLGELINEYYDGNCSEGDEQHEFMFDYLIPTMQNVLDEIKDDLLSTDLQSFAEEHTFSNLEPMINETWNWDNCFYNIILNGLENTYGFTNEIENNAINHYLYENYNDFIETYFSKNCN